MEKKKNPPSQAWIRPKYLKQKGKCFQFGSWIKFNKTSQKQRHDYYKNRSGCVAPPLKRAKFWLMQSSTAHACLVPVDPTRPTSTSSFLLIIQSSFSFLSLFLFYSPTPKVAPVTIVHCSMVKKNQKEYLFI